MSFWCEPNAYRCCGCCRASSFAYDWVVACQGSEDTNEDGTVLVGFGHHGDVFGDAVSPYLFYGDRKELIIDYIIDVDRSGRYLTHALGGAGGVVLVLDAKSGRLDLSATNNTIVVDSFRFGPRGPFAVVHETGETRRLRVELPVTSTPFCGRGRLRRPESQG